MKNKQSKAKSNKKNKLNEEMDLRVKLRLRYHR